MTIPIPETVKAELDNLSPADIKAPTIPVDVMIQESLNLYSWSQHDKDRLFIAGLAPELLDRIPALGLELQRAESLWFTRRFTKEELQRLWLTESKIADELRSELLHIFHFAYRKYPDIAKKISMISEGSSYSDKFQDLSDLHTIGTEHPEPLQAISADMDLLTRAQECATKLGMLLAESRAEDTTNGAKEYRDRVYTMLKASVDEVRSVGQFLFWKDKERLAGYHSNYYRKHRQKSSEKETAVAS